MATTKEEAIVSPAATGKHSLPLIPLILAVLVAVAGALALCSGLAYWMVRSGRIPLLLAPRPTETAIKAPPPTHLVALDPLLVNLADEDGRAYLRVSLTLQVEDPPPAKGDKSKEEAPAKGKAINPFEAAERDTALAVLGRQTSAVLLASTGKEQLKQQLRSAFADRVPEVKVQEVLLTEFLVQH